jgi:hypothetical protein
LAENREERRELGRQLFRDRIAPAPRIATHSEHVPEPGHVLTLIGPEEKLCDHLEAWRESSVTTALVAGDQQTLRTAAELVLGG